MSAARLERLAIYGISTGLGRVYDTVKKQQEAEKASCAASRHLKPLSSFLILHASVFSKVAGADLGIREKIPTGLSQGSTPLTHKECEVLSKQSQQ